jgi:hypothetical protein
MAVKIFNNNNVIALGSLTWTPQISFCGWINKINNGTGNVYLFIHNSTSNVIRHLGNNLFFRHTFTTTQGLWNTSDSLFPTTGIYHFCATYDYTDVNNDPKIYLNGNEVVTVCTQRPVGTANNLVAQAFIDNNAGRTQGYQHEVEDYRIYSKILSPQEVMSIYKSNGSDAIVDSLIVRARLNDGAQGVDPSTFGIKDVSKNKLGVSVQVSGTPRPIFNYASFLGIKKKRTA